MALKEVCIATGDVGGYTKEGDIVVVRNPLGGIGNKEGNKFLWLLMDEADIPEGWDNKMNPMRPGIDLDELCEVNPELDLAKCRCPETWHQPFFDTCPKTCKHRDLRERPVKVAVRSRLARAERRMRREENGQQPPKRG